MDGLIIFTTTLFVSFLSFSSFGNAQQWLYGRSSSLCYSEGKAFRCMPPFANIIENTQPDFTSSTCGQKKKQRICTDETSCHSCMKLTHPVQHMTDPHVNNNVTYWASDFVEPGSYVNITFSFHKLYEIYYISLVFISMLEPDSVIIEKSMDYGKNWSVWHYFSKDCQKAFGLPTTNMINYFMETKSDSEKSPSVLCGSLTDSRELKSPNSHIILAFTTSSSNQFSHLPESLLQWMSSTDIRISLRRFDASYPMFHMDGFTYPPLLKEYFNRFMNSSRSVQLKDENVKKNNLSPSMLKVGEYFAVADISVGGRCQCYGHAGRCLRNDKENTFYCDCQHNTAGKDCDTCKIGYVDRPWAPANVKSAEECKRCNCNLHSTKCSFDKKLYILSHRLSGGICEDCQHNTAGRYCHYCKTGYYRDWSKPLSHMHVCLKCRCHPIGSQYPNKCDQRSSQCTCKRGVTGLSCNRCEKGFQQTRSPIQPCVESFDVHKIPMAQAPENKCNQCNSKRKRIRFKKYCRKDAVLLVTIQSREQHADLIRFEIKVNYVWRINAIKFRKIQPDFLASINAIMDNQFGHTTFPLWIKKSDLDCGCPSLQLGMMYLVILKLRTIEYSGRSEMLLDQKSVALRWENSWTRRLKKFAYKEGKGLCVKWKKDRSRNKGRNN